MLDDVTYRDGPVCVLGFLHVYPDARYGGRNLDVERVGVGPLVRYMDVWALQFGLVGSSTDDPASDMARFPANPCSSWGPRATSGRHPSGKPVVVSV